MCSLFDDRFLIRQSDSLFITEKFLNKSLLHRITNYVIYLFSIYITPFISTKKFEKTGFRFWHPTIVKGVRVESSGEGRPKYINIGSNSLYTCNVGMCTVYLYKTNKRYIMLHCAGETSWGHDPRKLDLQPGETVKKVVKLRSNSSGLQIYNLAKTFNVECSELVVPEVPYGIFHCRLDGKTEDLFVKVGENQFYKVRKIFS
jgi:hypothetical protein